MLNILGQDSIRIGKSSETPDFACTELNTVAGLRQVSNDIFGTTLLMGIQKVITMLSGRVSPRNAANTSRDKRINLINESKVAGEHFIEPPFASIIHPSIRRCRGESWTSFPNRIKTFICPLQSHLTLLIPKLILGARVNYNCCFKGLRNGKIELTCFNDESVLRCRITYPRMAKLCSFQGNS